MKLTIKLTTILTAVVLFLNACTQHVIKPSTSLRDTLVKTFPKDDRGYRHLLLDNGLRVFLISDKTTTGASAALAVDVGSNADPMEYQGLAHFLEHMLFLGTEKYPDAGEYSNYIQQHGGSRNAYTDTDITNYYFSVDAEALDETLDRFAQFFIAPLFTESLTEREVNAVHSEYFTRLNNQGILLAEVIDETLNPIHPVRKFNVGNLQTLASGDVIKLRNKLIEFYKKHYTAKRMTLVLAGKEPLDQLEKMVVQKFSAIKSGSALVKTNPIPMFSVGDLPKQIQFKPLAESRFIRLSFPLGDYRKYYSKTPIAYVTNLFNHTAKGNLNQALKQTTWVESFSAGQGMRFDQTDTFNIGINLTESGVAHIDEIIAMVFQQIKLIKKQGINDWRYAEYKSQGDLQYHYAEKSNNTASLPTSLAPKIKLFAPQEIMRGAGFDEYDYDLIAKVINSLTPQNMLLVVMHPDVFTDKVTQFYDAKYSVQPISQDRQKSWDATPLSNLALPKTNLYMPKDLSLNKEQEPKVPVGLKTNNTSRLWHYPNHSYGLPKASISIALDRPKLLSLRDATLTSYYVALADIQLRQIEHYANFAGMSFSISGSGFSFNGFSDKLPLLIKQVFEGLMSPQFDPLEFEILKTKSLRNFKNLHLSRPSSYVSGYLGKLLSLDGHTQQEQIKVLESITFQEVLAIKNRLFTNVRLEMMGSGNITKKQVYAIADLVYEQLKITETNLPIPLDARVLRMPKAKDTAKLTGYILSSTDSAVLKYYQGRDNTRKEQMLTNILGAMIAQPYYEDLRTSQQLGYIVQAGMAKHARVPGINLIVQSPTASVDKIEKSNEKFIKEFTKILNKLTNKDLNSYRQPMINALLKAPTSLAEEVTLFWQQVRSGYPKFDLKELNLATLKSITIKDIQDLYQEIVINQPHSLSVVAVGDKDKPTNLFKNYKAFQKEHELETPIWSAINMH